MGTEPYHDKATLDHLYHGLGLTQDGIAEKFSVTPTTIRYWFRKLDVETPRRHKPYQDADTLRHLYHEEGMTQAEIADRFGVASNTISEWFRKLDITARPFEDKPYKNEAILRFLHHDEDLTWREIAEKFGVDTGTIQYWMGQHDIESKDPNRERYNIPEDEIRKLYVDREWSMRKCAGRFGCSPDIIRNRLDKYGIERRNPPEIQRLIHGETVPYDIHASTGYPRWKDGISGKELHVHRLLAISEGANPHKVFSGDYYVHHKNGCRLDNRPDNLKVLTDSQHMATHQRGEWTTRDGWPELVTAESEA